MLMKTCIHLDSSSVSLNVLIVFLFVMNLLIIGHFFDAYTSLPIARAVLGLIHFLPGFSLLIARRNWVLVYIEKKIIAGSNEQMQL